MRACVRACVCACVCVCAHDCDYQNIYSIPMVSIFKQFFLYSYTCSPLPVCLIASTTTTVEKFVDKAYKNAFMTAMHKLRQNEEYTDVTLQSGDVQIQCHRNVLAVASDSFKAMFRSGLEKSPSASVLLTMEPDILRKVIDYIYTGEIELTIDWNVWSLHATSYSSTH